MRFDFVQRLLGKPAKSSGEEDSRDRRSCALYLARTANRAIVFPHFFFNYSFEADGEGILCEPVEGLELGETLLFCIQSSRRVEPPKGHHERPRTDWPAFKLSRAKTVKSFEASFVRYGLQMEAPNFGALVGPDLKKQVTLKLSVDLGARSAKWVKNLGDQVLDFHQFYMQAERLTVSSSDKETRSSVA